MISEKGSRVGNRSGRGARQREDVWSVPGSVDTTPFFVSSRRQAGMEARPIDGLSASYADAAGQTPWHLARDPKLRRRASKVGFGLNNAGAWWRVWGWLSAIALVSSVRRLKYWASHCLIR